MRCPAPRCRRLAVRCHDRALAPHLAGRRTTKAEEGRETVDGAGGHLDNNGGA